MRNRRSPIRARARVRRWSARLGAALAAILLVCANQRAAADVPEQLTPARIFAELVFNLPPRAPGTGDVRGVFERFRRIGLLRSLPPGGAWLWSAAAAAKRRDQGFADPAVREHVQAAGRAVHQRLVCGEQLGRSHCAC